MALAKAAAALGSLDRHQSAVPALNCTEEPEVSDASRGLEKQGSIQGHTQAGSGDGDPGANTGGRKGILAAAAEAKARAAAAAAATQAVSFVQQRMEEEGEPGTDDLSSEDEDEESDEASSHPLSSRARDRQQLDVRRVYRAIGFHGLDSQEEDAELLAAVQAALLQQRPAEWPRVDTAGGYGGAWARAHANRRVSL